MYIEVLTLYGVFLLILFFFAEFTKKPVLGLFASLLLFPLGLWITTDDIQMRTGEFISTLENQSDNRAYNGTMLGAGGGSSYMNTSIDPATNDTLTNSTYIQAQETNYTEQGLGNVSIARSQTMTYAYATITAPTYFKM